MSKRVTLSANIKQVTFRGGETVIQVVPDPFQSDKAKDMADLAGCDCQVTFEESQMSIEDAIGDDITY